MIERYTPDGQLVRRLPMQDSVDLRVEDNAEEVEYRSDWGNQLPDGFQMEGKVVAIVGVVETDMDNFKNGNMHIVRVHFEDDPPGLDAWGWPQGADSVVVKKVLGTYGKRGLVRIKARVIRRQGANGLNPYWDLVDPAAPYEPLVASKKK